MAQRCARSSFGCFRGDSLWPETFQTDLLDFCSFCWLAFIWKCAQLVTFLLSSRSTSTKTQRKLKLKLNQQQRHRLCVRWFMCPGSDKNSHSDKYLGLGRCYRCLHMWNINQANALHWSVCVTTFQFTFKIDFLESLSPSRGSQCSVWERSDLPDFTSPLHHSLLLSSHKTHLIYSSTPGYFVGSK